MAAARRLISILFAACGGCLFVDPGVPQGSAGGEQSGTSDSDPMTEAVPTGTGPTAPTNTDGATATDGATTATDETSGGEPPGCGWQLSPAQGPVARIDATLTHDPKRGVLVLFGGIVGNVGQDLADTWEFDGQSWTKIPEDLGDPDRRRGHAAAYDPRREGVLMFGGFYDADFKLADGTWIRTDGEWHDVPFGGPSPRAYAAMAEHPGSERVVLFGGRTQDDASDETWLWDGFEWNQAAPNNRPSRRIAHQMALDEQSGLVLLYGGCKDSLCAERFDETWAWDGVDWSRLAEGEPTGPPTSGMAYDRSDSSALRFGAVAEARWSGIEWVTLDVGGARPSAQGRFAVAYEPSSTGVVLFGGLTAGLVARDETWIFRCGGGGGGGGGGDGDGRGDRS